MNIQLSIIGIGLIALFYCVGFAILIPFWRRLSPGWLRWTVITPLAFLVLALPVTDEVWITWHFNEYCKDAGVHVTRKVEVEGFYDDTGSGFGMKEGPITYAPASESFDKQGYRFYERKNLDVPAEKGVSHIEKINGQWQIRILKEPTARYHFKHSYQPRPQNTEEPLGLKIEKRERVVIDTETGETIGRETGFNRYPGWIDGLWINLLGSGLTQCPNPGQGSPREHLPRAVLSPLKSQ